MLVSVDNRRTHVCLRTFRMFLHLVAGEVVRSYLLNVYELLGKSDQ